MRTQQARCSAHANIFKTFSLNPYKKSHAHAHTHN